MASTPGKCITVRGKKMCRGIPSLAAIIRDTRRFCKAERVSKKKCDAFVSRIRADAKAKKRRTARRAKR